MDFAGYDNNAKCECATGNFGAALATLTILFDVIKDQLVMPSAVFLHNAYFVSFAMRCAGLGLLMNVTLFDLPLFSCFHSDYNHSPFVLSVFLTFFHFDFLCF